MSERKTMPFKCASCVGLRPIELHLHELSKVCDLLDNVRTPPSSMQTNAADAADAEPNTGGIAKWLLAASQIAEVVMDTSQFEEAHFYCEPVLDLQRSDAEHRGGIATRLTRFVFFCNALEEVYRFSEVTYDNLYLNKTSLASKGKKLKSASMKAGAVLRERAVRLTLPADFSHLVQNLARLAELYEQGLSVKLERVVNDATDIAYGLDIIRCLRNHVAHGTFPILDNPEYSWNMTEELKRAVLNLLNQAVRVGALYIQLLLAVDSDGFQSQLYDQLSDDPETGDYFTAHCTLAYVLSLHREQSFGLNESSYFRWWRYAEGAG